MFSLRDTIATALLGVQLSPEPDEVHNGAEKKGKKKAHKKRSAKNKQKSGAQPVKSYSVNNAAESQSEDEADSDEEADITNFGSTNAQTSEAKMTSALIHQFESTQIEDPLQIMIKKLAAECQVDTVLVSHTVNRMFDMGLPYDDYEAVKKELQPKAARRAVIVHEEPSSNYASAKTSPTAATASAPQPKAYSKAVGPPATSTHDAEAAAALAKLTVSAAAGSSAGTTQVRHGSPSRARHGREIPTTSATTTSAGAAAAAAAAAPHAPSNAAEPVLSSMCDKLDFVAGFSKTSLYDSLAALCSWAAVSLPASATGAPMSAEADRAQKVDAFFQSQALEILLNTMLADEAQQLSTRQEVSSAFHSLLQHVLLASNADPSGNAAVFRITEALSALIAQVSTLRGAQILPAFGSPSSHGHSMLAAQIASCVKRLYFQLRVSLPQAASANSASSGADKTALPDADPSNDGLLARLAEIDSQLTALEKGPKKTVSSATASAGPAADAGAQEKVQNMFLSREILNDKLQLCLESVQSLASHRTTSKSSGRPSTLAPPATATVSPAELQRSITDSASAIERTLLGECNLLSQANPTVGVSVSRIAPGPANTIQSKHQQNNHITSNYERLSYERDAKLAVLANDLNATNARVQELNTHKKRLLEQVALCDQEIGGLTARANSLTAEYSNSAQYYQHQLDQLAQTGNNVRKSLQAHDQVNNLLGAVRNFENKFADALLQQHQAALRQAAVTAAQARGASTGAVGARTATATAAAGAGGAQVGDEEHHALLSERVLLLSAALRSYVGSEGQCIKFLSERVETAQSKLATARKELLAYAALNMKGSVVQSTEATVTQLSAEIAEDQEAVRQLLYNVSDALAQARTVQAKLNPPAAGKAVGARGKAVAPDTAAQYAVDLPANECAKVVRHCLAVGVSVPAEIVALAGDATLPPSPAKAPAPAAVAPVSVPMVLDTATTGAAADGSVSTISAVATSSAAAQRKVPVDALRASRERANGKAGGKSATEGRDRDRDGRKRSAPDGKTASANTTATADTGSAIAQLEKSILQKQSIGGPAANAKPAGGIKSVVPAANAEGPKAVPRPVTSVWKIPTATSASAGEAESKTSEGVKSLRDIQAEQEKEKLQRAKSKSRQSAQPTEAQVTPAAATPALAATEAANDDAAPVEATTEGAAVETVTEFDVEASEEKSVATSQGPTSDSPAEPAVDTAAQATEEPTVKEDQESAVSSPDEPTTEPTVEPRKKASEEATAEPAEGPAVEVAVAPTVEPTVEPIVEPIVEPTVEPTVEPAVEPAVEPTVELTVEPVEEPAVEPVATPSEERTAEAATEPAKEAEASAVSPAEILATSTAEAIDAAAAGASETVQESGDNDAEAEGSAGQDESAPLPKRLNKRAKKKAKAAAAQVTGASSTEDETAVAVTAQSGTAEQECTQAPTPAIESPVVTVRSAADANINVTPSAAASNASVPDFTSPLVEFHDTYPAADDTIPMEGAAYPTPYPTATRRALDVGEGVNGEEDGQRSPLVEFHSLYPDDRERIDRVELREVEESSDDEAGAGAGDLSFDYPPGDIVSPSVVSVVSASSQVRDINPLARPSPGRASFRVKLDMEHSGAADEQLEEAETGEGVAAE